MGEHPQMLAGQREQHFFKGRRANSERDTLTPLINGKYALDQTRATLISLGPNSSVEFAPALFIMEAG